MPPIPSGPRPLCRTRATSEGPSDLEHPPSAVAPDPPPVVISMGDSPEEDLEFEPRVNRPKCPGCCLFSWAWMAMRRRSFDDDLTHGPCCKRRAVADWHVLLEFLWLLPWCFATITQNVVQNQLIIAGIMVAGVLASRIMTSAVDFTRWLAIPALAITLGQWIPIVYVLHLTNQGIIDISQSNGWNVTVISLVLLTIFRLWINFEYARSFWVIADEKERARKEEEERVASDAIWKEKQKLRKRAKNKRIAEEKARAKQERDAENGHLLADENTPSTSGTSQPSTSNGKNSHDHYYRDAEEVV